MANVAVLVLVLVMGWYVSSLIRHRGRGIVARRGMSIGADLGSLADKPRVRVREVTKAGSTTVRLILTHEPRPADDTAPTPSTDLDIVVFLREDEFGFGLLHEWKRSDTSLAIVMPPDTQIVRLRSIDDLQPLTLRRV